MESLKTKVRFSIKTSRQRRSLAGRLNKRNRPGADALESLWDSTGPRFFQSQGMGYSAAALDFEKTGGQNSHNKRLRGHLHRLMVVQPSGREVHKKQSRCGSLSVSLSNSKKQVRSNAQHLFPLAKIKTGCAATVKLQKGLAGNGMGQGA